MVDLSFSRFIEGLKCRKCNCKLSLNDLRIWFNSPSEYNVYLRCSNCYHHVPMWEAIRRKNRNVWRKMECITTTSCFL